MTAACQVGAPDCSGAFQGLSSHPTLGDFVYFVLNAAVVNVLPDITARSPLAHALYSGIVISGIALLARYATVLWTRVSTALGCRSMVRMGRRFDSGGGSTYRLTSQTQCSRACERS